MKTKTVDLGTRLYFQNFQGIVREVVKDCFDSAQEGCLNWEGVLSQKNVWSLRKSKKSSARREAFIHLKGSTFKTSPSMGIGRRISRNSTKSLCRRMSILNIYQICSFSILKNLKELKSKEDSVWDHHNHSKMEPRRIIFHTWTMWYLPGWKHGSYQ